MNKLFDYIFDICVDILVWMGHHTGMSYKAINVLVFCILGPVIFLVLLIIMWRQHSAIQMYKDVISIQKELHQVQ